MSGSDLRFHGDRVAGLGALDFAVNVWRAPRPPWLERALQAALADAARYPDPGPAREAVARRHDRPPTEALLLNGACEAFWLLAGTIAPRHAVCIHPAFTEPEAALRAAGHRITRVQRPSSDWRLEPDQVPDDADFVVLGNPNNPTGFLDRAGTVGALARPGRTLVVDESFIELTEDPGQSLAERGELPGLVVVRSLTKLWGLAGVRAGYLLAPAPLVAALEAARQPWSVNTLALAAIAACVERGAAQSEVARAVAAARRDLTDRLRQLPGLQVWPGAANFVLAHAPRGARLVDRLASRGIAVRPAHTFPGLTADHFRVAVRGAEDHERLARALREL